MQQTAAPARKGARLGTNPKTLHRKAMEKAAASPPPDGESLEAIFPAPPMAEATMGLGLASPTAAAADSGSPANREIAQAWSPEEEQAFQLLLAKRKAAGVRRRGRDLSNQRLTLGGVQPNPGTVVATIAALAAERGIVRRSELLDLMSRATFPNAKAKPNDKAWCQGYVAGALRDGFLALAAEATCPAEGVGGAGESSPNAAAEGEG